MKKIILCLLVFVFSVAIFAQSQTATVAAIRHHNGRTVWILDNGYEIWENTSEYKLSMVAPSGKIVSCFSNVRPGKLWANVQIGRQVELKEMKNILFKSPIYLPKTLKDYTVERTVVQVKRYTLKTRQGTGFFVNLYFRGIKQPVSVDINENPLWLEIQPGMKVKERRINGNVYYFPIILL